MEDGAQEEAPGQPVEAASGPRRSQPEFANSAVRPAFRAEAMPEMRKFIEYLLHPGAGGGPFTEEHAVIWRENLRRLIQQGGSAVPAIQEFLDKNLDFDFGQVGQKMLGYSGARAAMIDALGQIGGADAINSMADLLRKTADPREIAQLARNLEKVDPGYHQQEALDAARETLLMAGEGNLAGRDVGPLFDMFTKYGDARAVGDLEQSAGRWNYYAASALAQLPEGAGIPTLIQMAARGGGAKAPALGMLAQVATQSPDARAALVNQAHQNLLSPYDWAVLGPFLKRGIS